MFPHPIPESNRNLAIFILSLFALGWLVIDIHLLVAILQMRRRERKNKE